MAIAVESFFLAPGGQGSLQHRLRQMVTEGILSGRFRPGDRMPSTRALAAHLGVARITVTLAYADLVASDYLLARGRSGTFVSSAAPDARRAQPLIQHGPSADWARLLHPRAQGLRHGDIAPAGGQFQGALGRGNRLGEAANLGIGGRLGIEQSWRQASGELHGPLRQLQRLRTVAYRGIGAGCPLPS